METALYYFIVAFITGTFLCILWNGVDSIRLFIKGFKQGRKDRQS